MSERSSPLPARIAGALGTALTGRGEGGGSTREEGDPHGLGIGAHIDVTFDHPVDLQMVCIQNGWTISEPTFVRNGRVRLMKVTTDAGSTVDGIPDKSADGFTAYQRIDVASGATSTVHLEIESVNAPYALEAGKVTNEDDTAISEIEFWAR